MMDTSCCLATHLTALSRTRQVHGMKSNAISSLRCCNWFQDHKQTVKLPTNALTVLRTYNLVTGSHAKVVTFSFDKYKKRTRKSRKAEAFDGYQVNRTWTWKLRRIYCASRNNYLEVFACVIHLNIPQSKPSLFLFALLLPLWGFSTLTIVLGLFENFQKLT